MSRCAPRILLSHSRSVTKRDIAIRKRLIDLYTTLKRDFGEVIRNVTEIVINAQYIYTQYMVEDVGRIVIYDNKDESDDLSTKDEHVFIASVCLAITIWQPDHYDDLFLSVVDKISRVSYPSQAIHESIMIVFYRLRGSIIREPIMHDFRMKRGVSHALLMWFSSYRYMALIEPRHIRSAISVLTHDIEHSLQHGLLCRRHENENVRFLCQIMVNFFGEILDKLYSDNTESVSYPILKLLGTFRYIDDSDKIPVFESAYEERITSLYRELDHDSFECIDILANKQASGTMVYRGLSTDKERLTIKRYTLEREEGLIDTHRMWLYIREVALVVSLRKFDDCICTIKGIGFDRIERNAFLYMSPHCNSLYEFANKNRTYFTEATRESILYDMAMALTICHENDIVHYDLKPDNFIVEDCRVKLIDFGIATCHFSYASYHSDNVQTIDYRAPELLLGDTKHDASVDIWAFACTAYEILTGFYLFGTHKKDRVDSKKSSLSLYERNRRFRIIMKRLGIEYYDKEAPPSAYLRECPLWEKCVVCMIPVEPPLGGKYIPIEWQYVNDKLETLLKECINLTPDKRPSAYSIVERLERHQSLF